ncbi:MAG: hypothetical protein HY823_00640 [Acidobacteria bacterium]|nr:hypothetical protein [Acidobacteriota bacterium]
MPIYAPTLPPRAALNAGQPAWLVLARFDVRRILRQKLGRFFGFVFVFILAIRMGVLYVNHLLDTKAQLASVKDLAKEFLAQGASFQADCLPPWLLTVLWFQVAVVGGGLVARDTLHRVRPLMYAHPLRPLDYLGAKGLVAAGLPFLIQLPFVLLPWTASLLIAGLHGPIWPTAPLRLIPAALLISALMGAVTLGASSMASTPRAGFGWVLGIVLGSAALGGMVAGILGNPAWLAFSPGVLVTAWPELLCGVQAPKLGWVPALLGTGGHIAFWLWISARRTRPSEAVI